ncbi:ArsR family transcriptional regulator [Salarchaeum sp. III]|uniref:helix-turn-helix transcriptional regulator n=1 Tax=Salarchaeum sp. III TaxID=3107927 RepID=UPI002EDAB972
METDVSSADGLPLDDGFVDAVAFLARSQHRMRVLDVLADGAHPREDLLDATGATRVTLSRILGDLEDRSWIVHEYDPDRYALTDLGHLVHEDLTRLLRTVSVGQRLDGVFERLPTDWFGFDPRCLADARLLGSDSADPSAPARAVADAVVDANRVRALVGSFTALPLYAYAATSYDESAPDATVVYDPSAAAVVAENDDLAHRRRSIEADCDDPVYYRTGASLPCNVDIIDDTVYLSIGNDSGGFQVVETDHPAVVSWAREEFTAVRENAVSLREWTDERT